jgi:hypothetical protein
MSELMWYVQDMYVSAETARLALTLPASKVSPLTKIQGCNKKCVWLRSGLETQNRGIELDRAPAQPHLLHSNRDNQQQRNQLRHCNEGQDGCDSTSTVDQALGNQCC